MCIKMRKRLKNVVPLHTVRGQQRSSTEGFDVVDVVLLYHIKAGWNDLTSPFGGGHEVCACSYPGHRQLEDGSGEEISR